MIAASRLWRVWALVAAVLIHAAIGWALMADIDIEMEGSSGAEEARIGTSFADMAAGTLEATETEDTTESIEPDTAEPIEHTPAEPVELKPVQHSEALTPTETPRAVPEVAEDAVPTIAALTPETLAEPSPSPQQAETVTAEPVEAALEADEEEAVSRSLRPKRRSEEFEKKNERIAKPAAPKPTPKPKPKPKKPSQPKKQPRGNAEQNSRAGAATGNTSAKATTSGTTGSSDATSGNAAASNYPGKVMQRLSRARRPRVGSRGTAAVAFTISDGGGLSAVSIANSSGSAALDRAAVQMIRGAAPFPAPPPGAQRSFSIRIEGR